MSRPQRYFGIVEDLSGNIGQGLIANSYNETNTVQTAVAQDEKGRTIDIASYDESREVTINGLFVGTGLKAGEVVHISDRDYLVTSSAKNEANSDFVRSSVSLRAGNEDTVVWPLSGLQS